MSSIALALKYRPTLFSDLVGQNAISQTLSLALDSKHISHAYLFSGLRGSGKTSSARIFARALECDSGPTSTPCGTCANCESALQGKHLDIIEMDAASSRGIDDIKRVIEQTKYRPSLGRYKIFIIDEVHMLSKEAFNALLKTLEEPPEYVKFILATTDPLKLPATILSRTQHFRFKQIPHRLVIEHISMILNKEGVSFESQALDMIARAGSGSLRDTLTLLDQAIIFCKNHIEVAGVSDMLGIVDPQVLNEFFHSIVSHNEARAQEILSTLQEYECEMILDEMMLYLKDRLLLRDRDFPPLLLDRFARIVTESKSLLSLNTDGGFVLLLCTLKLQEATKVKDIESMIEELESELFSYSQAKLPSKASLEAKAQDLQVRDSQVCEVQAPLADTTQAPATNALQTPPYAQQEPSATPQEQPKEQVLDSQKRGALQFQSLIQKIKDRNVELGNVFESCVHFVEFDTQRSLLRWRSEAQGEDKERLREFGKIIRALVLEVFGAQVHIEQVQDSQTQVPQSPPPSAQNPQEQHNQFISEHRDVIEAIHNSIGIKEVITQGGGNA